jgi:hypothetical protein
MRAMGIKTKNPDLFKVRVKKDGGDILSHNKCSTICADGLNYSVRNGKRWAPSL